MTYWEPEGFHRLGEGELAEVTADEVFQRMYEATGTKCQMELANWLGARQSWLSDAKRRNIMPIRWLQILALKHSEYSPVWVLTGKGEKEWSGYRFTSAGLRGLQLGYYTLPDPEQKK